MRGAINRLTKAEQRQVRQWLADGIDDWEVRERIERQFGKRLTIRSVRYHKRRVQEESDSPQTSPVMAGWEKGKKRSEFIRRRLDEIETQLESTESELGAKERVELAKEARAWLGELRKELEKAGGEGEAGSREEGVEEYGHLSIEQLAALARRGEEGAGKTSSGAGEE